MRLSGAYFFVTPNTSSLSCVTCILTCFPPLPPPSLPSLPSPPPLPHCHCSSSVPVYFADGSKVKLNMLPSNTTSDLLDHEKVKDKLTSSAAQLWFIDNRGNG